MRGLYPNVENSYVSGGCAFDCGNLLLIPVANSESLNYFMHSIVDEKSVHTIEKFKRKMKQTIK